MSEHLWREGYVLCKGCERGLHLDHEDGPCQCDLCEESQ